MQTIRILPVAGPDPECQRVESIKVCWLSFIPGLFRGIKSCAFQNIKSSYCDSHFISCSYQGASLASKCVVNHRNGHSQWASGEIQQSRHSGVLSPIYELSEGN